MKLTELAIDNFGACQNLRLDRFSNGLNVLYGASGTGKTTLLKYIQNVLFGFSKSHPGCSGNLTFRVGDQFTKLSRTAKLNADLVVDLSASIHSTLPIQEYLQQVGPNLFNAIYRFDSNNHCTAINQIIHQLRDRFNVVTGKPAWQEQVEPLHFYNEHRTRSEERDLVLAEVRELESERSHLLSRTKPGQLVDPTPRVELESEIDQLSYTIGQYDLQSLREMVATTDSQIRETRSQLEEHKEETLPNQGGRYNELLSTLYGHLDDLDQQVREGRRLQTAVQAQRLRLRDEIQQLFTEMAQQHQQIRQAAATSELKQLRLQYTGMAENLSHLMNRRQETLTKIQQLDASGAQVIQRGDPNYLRRAADEGHWVARCRFLGKPQPAQGPTDDSEDNHLQGRLTELQDQRKQLVLQLVDQENCLGQLQTQLASLRSKRTQIEWEPTHALDAQLCKIENRLRQLEDKSRLLSEFALTPRYPDFQQDPLLRRAGQLASQLTVGEVSDIWLHEAPGGQHFQLITEGRHQDSIAFQSLNSTAQRQVALSLCLAAVESLNRHGISVPMLLDDAWTTLDPVRIKATVELLDNFCRQGIQIIAVTSDRGVVSRARGSRIKLHEIPEAGHACRQWVTREHSQMSTGVNPIGAFHDDHHAVANTTVFADLSTPITYSLANYSTDRGTTPNDPETVETDDTLAFQAPPNETELPERTLPPDGLVLEFAPLVDESTPLINFELFTPSNSSSLQKCGIRDVSDLLNQNTEQLAPELAKHGFRTEDLEAWQSITWLMICVPGLRIEDAHLLRSIGIAEPEQLFTTTSLHLADRLHRELSTNRDVSVYWRPDDYSAERINRWYRALDRTQSRWQSTRGYSRLIRAKGQSADKGGMDPVGPSSQPIRLATARTASPTRKRKRRSREAVDSKELTIANTTARPKEKKRAKSKSSKAKKEAKPLKFHLDLEDHIEAAPSIGPKTASRFQGIGVFTIKEFLGSSAESMEKAIHYKHISARSIQTWQDQAQLVCRIPNLRGHDAKILVACGITEPEMLNSMSPDELYSIVKPFSETKQGIKIIRSGKKPDINEVRDWIQWSNQNRTLKAA